MSHTLAFGWRVGGEFAGELLDSDDALLLSFQTTTPIPTSKATPPPAAPAMIAIGTFFFSGGVGAVAGGAAVAVGAAVGVVAGGAVGGAEAEGMGGGGVLSGTLDVLPLSVHILDQLNTFPVVPPTQSKL